MDMTEAWVDSLMEVMDEGAYVAPRDRLTKEVLHRTIDVNMRRPVLRSAKRKLSYRFMAAEAYWILTGSNLVKDIAPYNQKIAEFSDDGEIFFGAYGPKIVGQLDYVVDKLASDPESRQAGLTIWRENPPRTKDVPCTVAIFFSIRDEMLNAHVFMRSSDLWLGLPYDVFNFSMLGHLVCGKLIERGLDISPGTLFLTAASSHIYKENWDGAYECIDEKVVPQVDTPEVLFRSPQKLLDELDNLRGSRPGSDRRWWESEL